MRRRLYLAAIRWLQHRPAVREWRVDRLGQSFDEAIRELHVYMSTKPEDGLDWRMDYGGKG